MLFRLSSEEHSKPEIAKMVLETMENLAVKAYRKARKTFKDKWIDTAKMELKMMDSRGAPVLQKVS